MTEEFYTNKELYEKFTTEIKELTENLQETKQIIVKYNGLRENQGEMFEKIKEINNNVGDIDKKVGELDDRLICIETEKKTKEKTGISVREWGLLAVAVLSLFVTILALTGVIG